MATKAIRGEGIISYSIEGLTPREFEQLCEMRTRVHEVLESHKHRSEKKVYLTDDELFLIEAMLEVLTGALAVIETSNFDRLKKNLMSVYNKSNPETPIEDATFD